MGGPAGVVAEPTPKDGTVTLKISHDRMEVRATVDPPQHGGAPMTEAAIGVELAKAKVLHGIDQEAVRRLAASAGGQSEFVVARGTPPIRGEDGVLLPSEMLQTPSGYPRLREDGTADFFELNMVRNVAEGAVLVTRAPATRGTPGTDVLGRTLAAIDGQEARLYPGAGTKLSSDGQGILAAVAGHAVMSDRGEVSVTPIFTVRGDVDFGTGNIDFVGTVVILGDLQSGFTVKAGQKVEIHGGVMGGSVEAGGEVVVRCGILAGSRVQAGANLSCRFVEGSEVKAGGDVMVADAILNAQVTAGGNLAVTGRRGTIVGGRIRARSEVSTRYLGSPACGPVEVEVGLGTQGLEELERLQRENQRVEERLLRANQTLSYLREIAARPGYQADPGHTWQLQQALRHQKEFQAEREVLVKRLEELREIARAEQACRIRAFEMVYPSVRIVIGSGKYLVIDQCPNICFFVKEGAVTIGPN